MNSSSGSPASTAKESRPIVFFVDDEPLLLEWNKDILESAGFCVLTFRDPIAAVRAYLLADPKPALLITDFAMSGMNGLEVIRACRRVNPAQKIMLVSGTVDESAFQNAEDKPNRFLAKPYPGQRLTDLVRALLAE